MDPAMQKSVQYLTEIEELAQDIMTEKETKLELSNAQNKYREAIRALQQTDRRKTWLKCGLVDVELPVDECKSFLEQGKLIFAIHKENVFVYKSISEMKQTTTEINRLHSSIRAKLSKIRDLEHEPGIVGMSLKPMSVSEAKAINKAFGVFR